MMKKLYLAGPSEALAKAFADVKGVLSTLPVRAQATNNEELLGIEVEYNPKKQDICGILEVYFSVVDPFAKLKEPLEQAAIFYTSQEDIPQLDYYARFLQSRGHEPGAALGNLIVNDSITDKGELRPLQLRFGRLKEALPLKAEA
ncbi:MAG: hypothetical protein SO119_04710 [Phascolarctobacterium sp.]|nr:hypothetical protein [Phascolarctobacterium sp.]